MYLGTRILEAVRYPGPLVTVTTPPQGRETAVQCQWPVAVSHGKKTSHHDGGRREARSSLFALPTVRDAARRIASRSLLLPVLGWSPPEAVGSLRSRLDKISCDFLNGPYS